MNRWIYRLALLAMSWAMFQDSALADDEENNVGTRPERAKVVVIPVRSQISKPELYILRRGLKTAIENKADTVVLDMKTPGGALNITLEMMEALDRFEGKTITFVNNEAGSAGAIIAAVTDEVHFAPTGVIGAAEVIFGTGQDVGEGIKRKINSFLSAKIRAFSEDKPFRADVIRAMMDPDFEFKVGEEIIKPEGELLTLTAAEAMQEYGDPPVPLLGSGISKNLGELLDKLHGPGNYEVTSFEITWSERLAQHLTAWAPLLMGAGLLLMFIEFKTPGFGVFGIAGAVVMGIVFFGHHAAGLSGHEPLLLFALGALLILVELFFFPGTLVFAISGAALILGSLVWSMADLWPDEPMRFTRDLFLRPLLNVTLGVGLAALAFLAMLRFLPKGGLWGRMVLEAAVAGAPTGLRDTMGGELAEADSIVGQQGVAATGLFPSGQVDVAGRRYEARLVMGFADAGTPVRVTARKEFGLEVEKLT